MPDETPDVEIPDDEGAPDTGPRDVPDAGDGDPTAVDLAAGDANDLSSEDDAEDDA